jgi:hypothetical protein
MKKITAILLIIGFIACGRSANNELINADTVEINADTLMIDSVALDTMIIEK